MFKLLIICPSASFFSQAIKASRSHLNRSKLGKTDIYEFYFRIQENEIFGKTSARFLVRTVTLKYGTVHRMKSA